MSTFSIWSFILVFIVLLNKLDIWFRIYRLRKRGLYPQDEKQAVMADVEKLARNGERIMAIRLYRKMHPGIPPSQAIETVKQFERKPAST